jgi:hypothetical protein
MPRWLATNAALPSDAFRCRRPELCMVEVEVAYGASRGTLLLNMFGSTIGKGPDPAVVSITRRGDPGRREAERLIEAAFQRKYGARLTGHYPNLISVASADGEIIASVGFRGASEEPLFLEAYLDTPIETALSAAAGRDVQRAEIVEIGSLAATSHGASPFLFVTLAALLQYRGFTYATATATRALRRWIEALDFPLVTLGVADPRRLADRGAAWGSYYAAQPRIVAGDIAQCFERLAHFLPPERNPDLASLLAGDDHFTPEGRA